MKNNDFEEDRTRRGEKKDNKDDKKRQYELPKGGYQRGPAECAGPVYLLPSLFL